MTELAPIVINDIPSCLRNIDGTGSLQETLTQLEKNAGDGDQLLTSAEYQKALSHPLTKDLLQAFRGQTFGVFKAHIQSAIEYRSCIGDCLPDPELPAHAELDAGTRIAICNSPELPESPPVVLHHITLDPKKLPEKPQIFLGAISPETEISLPLLQSNLTSVLAKAKQGLPFNFEDYRKQLVGQLVSDLKKNPERFSKGVDLIFVLDVSKSMKTGEQLVLRSLETIVREIHAQGSPNLQVGVIFCANWKRGFERVDTSKLMKADDAVLDAIRIGGFMLALPAIAVVEALPDLPDLKNKSVDGESGPDHLRSTGLEPMTPKNLYKIYQKMGEIENAGGIEPLGYGGMEALKMFQGRKGNARHVIVLTDNDGLKDDLTLPVTLGDFMETAVKEGVSYRILNIDRVKNADSIQPVNPQNLASLLKARFNPGAGSLEALLKDEHVDSPLLVELSEIALKRNDPSFAVEVLEKALTQVENAETFVVALTKLQELNPSRALEALKKKAYRTKEVPTNAEGLAIQLLIGMGDARATFLRSKIAAGLLDGKPSQAHVLGLADSQAKAVFWQSILGDYQMTGSVMRAAIQDAEAGQMTALAWVLSQTPSLDADVSNCWDQARLYGLKAKPYQEALTNLAGDSEKRMAPIAALLHYYSIPLEQWGDWAERLHFKNASVEYLQALYAFVSAAPMPEALVPYADFLLPLQEKGLLSYEVRRCLAKEAPSHGNLQEYAQWLSQQTQTLIRNDACMYPAMQWNPSGSMRFSSRSRTAGEEELYRATLGSDPGLWVYKDEWERAGPASTIWYGVGAVPVLEDTLPNIQRLLRYGYKSNPTLYRVHVLQDQKSPEGAFILPDAIDIRLAMETLSPKEGNVDVALAYRSVTPWGIYEFTADRAINPQVIPQAIARYQQWLREKGAFVAGEQDPALIEALAQMGIHLKFSYRDPAWKELRQAGMKFQEILDKEFIPLARSFGQAFNLSLPEEAFESLRKATAVAVNGKFNSLNEEELKKMTGIDLSTLPDAEMVEEKMGVLDKLGLVLKIYSLIQDVEEAHADLKSALGKVESHDPRLKQTYLRLDKVIDTFLKPIKDAIPF